MAKTDKSELVKGIDLSAYDGVPDFAALKKAGIAFVIVRAGYGQGNEDPTAKKNLLEAKKNGIPGRRVLVFLRAEQRGRPAGSGGMYRLPVRLFGGAAGVLRL